MPHAEASRQTEPTAVEVVTDHIRSLILQKKLRIGDKIPTESDLCGQLGVGRGSVREAVKRLEAIHVLEIRRGDGTYIADIGGAQALDSLYFKIILEDITFEELLEYRLQIEIAIMNLAICNGTQADIERLETNYAAFEKYIEEDAGRDPEVLSAMDVEFHGLMGKCAKNTLMEDIYLFSLNLFSPFMLENYKIGKVDYDSQATLDNHKDILDAIKKRDMLAGVYAVKSSLKLWKKWIDKCLAEK